MCQVKVKNYFHLLSVNLKNGKFLTLFYSRKTAVRPRAIRKPSLKKKSHNIRADFIVSRSSFQRTVIALFREELVTEGTVRGEK